MRRSGGTEPYMPKLPRGLLYETPEILPKKNMITKLRPIPNLRTHLE